MGSNLELTSRDDREIEREKGEEHTDALTQTWCLEEAFNAEGLNQVVDDKENNGC